MRRLPRVRLFASAIAVPLLFALAGGCSTYKSDLERAKGHYQANEFERSLALLRILEQDMDSLSWSDRAEYAYTRGMTDYRLAELAKKTEGVNDPRKAFRAHARHWLGVAAAIEKNHPQSLTGEFKTRLEQTMVDLNREVFGGGEGTPAAGGGDAKACKSDGDCDKFQLCEGNVCVAPAKKAGKKDEL